MGHDVDDQEPRGAVDTSRAARLASTLAAIADPLRLRVVTALREGPSTVAELAAELDVPEAELSAPVDHLVEIGLVGAGAESPVAYTLHDDHVESLLDEAVSHDEHRAQGLDDRVAREL